MCEVVKFWNAPRDKQVENAAAGVGSGSRLGLVVKRGRTLIHLILMDSAGIRVRKLPLTEDRYITRLDYSVARAKKRFRAAFKSFGGSREARRWLKG